MADFRSDTLTQPTPAMREAMVRAVVGDDVFGEDPTVRQLEREGAAWLGMEAALFVPSGTMANQIAVHVHCRPGDELICDQSSHVFRFEAGAAARLSGVQVRALPTERGFLGPEQLAAAVLPENDHHPRSRLVVVENTHNMAGGTVLAPSGMAALVEVARRSGLAVHIDGARLVNAAVAAGCAATELTRGADSVSMCFSKGMGAPVGSLIAGSTAFVAAARRARKAFGGGMRQAGVLAAPALIALGEGAALAAADHRRAARLAEGLGAFEMLDVPRPDSNIVMVDVRGGQAPRLLEYLGERGVHALLVGPARLRFVTHRDVGDDDVAKCIEAVAAWAHVAAQREPESDR